MTDAINTQQVSWAWATDNTDPITSNDDVMSFFGKHSQPWGFFPMATPEIIPAYFGDILPTLYRTKVNSALGVGYVVTNPLGYYRAMGKKVSHDLISGSVYETVIDFRDPGNEVPVYVVRSTDQHPGESAINEHWLGAKTDALTVSFDNSLGNGMLTAVEDIKSVQPASPSFNPTPTHPGSNQAHYKHDSNLAITYDTSGTPVTGLKNQYYGFSIRIDNALKEDPDHSDGSYFPKGFIESNAKLAGSFIIPRGAIASPYTDWMDDIKAGNLNKKDWEITLYRDADHFIKHEISNMTFVGVRRPNEVSRVPTYLIDWMAEGMTVTARHNLNTADYFGVA